jgi:hypothetical protein
MTKEIRTLIDLRDILGIEIECQNQKCKAKIMLPIQATFADNNPRCFQCNEPWFGASFNPETGQPFVSALRQLNDLMRRIVQLSSGGERSDIHVPIRLQIANLSPVTAPSEP